MTVAGFDPSGGAGVLADVKAFEANKVYGFAVVTANTIQNEHNFVEPNWIPEEQIFSQLTEVLKEHVVDYVKVGLIPSLSFLKELNAHLLRHSEAVKVIWDPVLSASAGHSFDHDLSALEEILSQIYLITPNWDEVKLLGKSQNALEAATHLSQYTHVYLKGGHNESDLGKDFLYFKGKVYPFNPKKVLTVAKHGSGCVFSAALTANLARRYPIVKACLRSKTYTAKFLASDDSLLGYHGL